MRLRGGRPVRHKASRPWSSRGRWGQKEPENDEAEGGDLEQVAVWRHGSSRCCNSPLSG